MEISNALSKDIVGFELPPHISTSDLPYIRRSPYHYLMNRVQKPKPTPAMILGNIIHTMVLEPKLFDKRYFYLNESEKPNKNMDYRDKENRLWKQSLLEKHKDKIPVSDSDMEIAVGIRDNVYKDKFLTQLFDNLEFEYTIEWEDKDTELKLHSRLDGLIKEQNIIVELKSITDASTISCIREIKKNIYNIKAAFQIRGAEQYLGSPVKYYIFLFVEKQYPYYYNKILLSQETIADADLKLSELLEDIAICRKNNTFPAYEKESDNELGLIEVHIY